MTFTDWLVPLTVLLWILVVALAIGLLGAVVAFLMIVWRYIGDRRAARKRVSWHTKRSI